MGAMKLSTLATTVGIFLADAASAAERIHGEMPMLILPNGATVYHTPPSAGFLRLLPAHPPTEGELRERELHRKLHRERRDADEAEGRRLEDDGDEDEDFLMDDSGLEDLTLDVLTVDLSLALGGGASPIVFQRDFDYDAVHPRSTPDEFYEPRGPARELRRRRHRRVQDLCEEQGLLQDVTCDAADASRVDYLPANPHYDPLDPTQRFEYFEGRGSYLADGNSTTSREQATAYLKRMNLPDGRGSYMSGIVSTPNFDFLIKGDVDTGETRVTKADPRSYPSMPEPRLPPDDPSESVFEGPEEDGPVPKKDGGRRLKQIGNLRSGGREEGERTAMPDNPFGEQIKRQADAFLQKEHLVGEKRRRQRQRRTQTDDGSVVDMLIVYTENAMCEAKGKLNICGGGDPSVITEDPANHIEILNVAEASIAWTNQAYVNSHIQTQLRLVFVYMTPDMDDGAGYSCGSALDAVTRADPEIDEVHGVREEYGADMVALLTSVRAGGCGGIAWVGPANAGYMYSLTKQRYSIGGTFAHEVGHNFGCLHDRNNSGNKLSHHYGWQDPDALFRTIMAYGCPNGYCGRIQYFSNKVELRSTSAGDRIMGDARNDCARVHNDNRARISQYRNVRLTHAPTTSPAPSVSYEPSESPTDLPTLAPTKTHAPSLVPSTSLAPSDVPSMFPTWGLVDLETLERIASPGSVEYELQRGVMFDITAKEYQITIRQFSTGFVRGGEMVVSIYSREGGFWYEKNNEEAWTQRGQPPAYSPGITLGNPVPFTQRGEDGHYGFLPIVIPPHTTFGIYIFVDPSSEGENLIGMDRKSDTSCDADFVEPYDFQTWFEDVDMAVSDGIYKNDWRSATGTAHDSYRFLGSIWYETARPGGSRRRRLLGTDDPREVGVGSGRGLSDYPPEQYPVIDRKLQDLEASSSSPSETSSPSFMPSFESIPLSSPSYLQVIGYDGYMFVVHAKDENIVVRNLAITTYSEQFPNHEVELSVWTSLPMPDGHYDAPPTQWAEHLPITITTTPTVTPEPLPEYMGRPAFSPVTVKAGTYVGFYVTIKDPRRNHKILVKKTGTSVGAIDLEDSNVSVLEGVGKQWDHCLNWGETLVNESGNKIPHKFYGSVIYSLTGSTSLPTPSPSIKPSNVPSTSVVPSNSRLPSRDPSTSPSVVPTSSLLPSEAATEPLVFDTLVTPVPGEYATGSSADGVMFDIIAKSPLQISSITMGQMASFPMNIRLYTRRGSHYDAYDDETKWESIAYYSNFTYASGNSLNFPPQYTGTNQTRAFYIAILETYGETFPMLSGLANSFGYLDEELIGDGTLSIMKGIKFFGISDERPFGNGTFNSGVFQLGAPGGLSYNLQGASIKYRPIATITPSISPSTSQVPSASQSPSSIPTASSYPSLSPSISASPSSEPSVIPSTSFLPSEKPSGVPSAAPSTSVWPSQRPSVSSAPSSDPSFQPSSVPSGGPSESPSTSFQPSETPSMTPSESPSVSFEPSLAPSSSLMPSSRKEVFTSPGGPSNSWVNGIMFEVVPKRAMSIETFHVDTHGSNSRIYQFHIYTKPGPLTSSSWSNAAEWTKMNEEIVWVTTSSNPVKIPASYLTPVTVYAGQTQSFYIASIDEGTFVASKVDTASEDDAASMYPGRKFHPITHPEYLFSSSGTNGYNFRGKMLYTYRSDHPSMAPSFLPTGVASMIPSNAPSEAEFPSFEPSISMNPSSSPPTASPTMPPSLSPTDSQPKLQITIPAKFSVSGFGIPETQAQIATVITILAPSLAELASKDLRAGQSVKEVIILSINGIAVTGEGLRHRQLVSRALQGGGIDIEYEVILEQICADTDCSNAQEIADALYDAVTETMQNDIDSGVFAQIVTATAEEQGTIVEVAIANSDFEDLVVLVLALASIWYPAWTTGEYCSNDGEQPFYMKYNPGSWLYNSRDACCTRYYSYDYASCMGIDSMAVIGFYPAWDGTKKCRNDAEVPDYMRRNPSQWVYDDLESCCERYYSSEQAGCLTNSGGNPTDSASLEWYVDHENEVCVQDCLEDSGGQCGGLVSPWKTLFESPSACCETTLTWISTSSCTFASLGQTNPGTFKWYSNFAENRCVMDCPKSATCGGILESAYVDLHETAEDCCSSKLGWVEIDNCTSESTNTPISSSGTDGYYLNERLNRCVQNCIGVAPCGGLRKSWNELFSTAGDCCATKLWWLERSTCLSGTS